MRSGGFLNRGFSLINWPLSFVQYWARGEWTDKKTKEVKSCSSLPNTFDDNCKPVLADYLTCLWRTNFTKSAYHLHKPPGWKSAWA